MKTFKTLLLIVSIGLFLPILKTVYVYDVKQDMSMVYASEINTLKEDNLNQGTYNKNEINSLKNEISKKNKLNSQLSSTLSKVSTKDIPLYNWGQDFKCPTYIGTEMFRIWKKSGGKHSYVPYCIAWYESNFNTMSQQVTSSEDSRGLFQVNLKLYAHRKNFKNRNEAFNPRLNMNYQFKELVRYEKQGISKGLAGVNLIIYVAKYGQRPKWGSWIEKEIKKAYKHYNSNLIK